MSRTLAVLLALVAAPAAAHGPWLLPSSTSVGAAGDIVTVDAAGSDEAFVPGHPTPLDTIMVTAPDGTPGQITNGSTGRLRSTFDLVLDKPGTWKIATEQSGVTGSFRLNGEDWRVGRRGPPPGATQGQPRAGGATQDSPGRNSVATPADIPAGATDIKLAEMITRDAVFVTAGVPDKTVLALTGKGLEADFLSHPTDLVANEPARIRFLIDGKPAAGIKVEIVAGGRRYRDADDPIAFTTGADGTITIKWPAPGMYWLDATATDAHPGDPKATERRMSSAVTLEVAAP